jgi:murein L,D-transpeptidase YcbB/YkuD
VFLLIVMLFVTSVTFADVLKIDSKGEDVTKLQSKLKEKGYFTVGVTGHFGSITEAAVKKFQAENNLTVDGLAGEQTMKALFGAEWTSSKSVELLDWWSEASKIFKIGMTAKVTDVKK